MLTAIIIFSILFIFCELMEVRRFNRLCASLDELTKKNDQEILDYVKYVVEQLKNNKEALTFSEWNR